MPRTRLSRILVFTSGVHRCATGSPARCTTASALTRLSGGGASVIGSHLEIHTAVSPNLTLVCRLSACS